jgi:hypothetical protein
LATALARSAEFQYLPTSFLGAASTANRLAANVLHLDFCSSCLRTGAVGKPWLKIASIAGLMSLFALPARAQRVEFPTPAPSALPSPAASYPASAPALPTFDPYALPANSPPMSAPYIPPAGSTYAAPGAYPTAPVYGGTPGAVFPEGAPVYNGPTFGPIGDYYTRTVRLLQEIHVDETWLARGGGDRALGINTINTWASFGIPVGLNPNPVLITPGFQLYLWDGPDATGDPPPTLPPNTYGAYLDVAWNPQINNWFSAELEVSPGIYTDFTHTTTDSLRILGRGMGVFTISPTMQFKLGVWYIDRLDIKLLPAGGIVWTPSPDARYEITFPAPKLAHRCSTIGNHDIWAYLRGEYGGGAWTCTRPAGGGLPEMSDEFEYSDIRLALGVDVLPETKSGLRGYLEVGYSFNRVLVFRSGMPSKVDISDTVLVGGGLSF